MIESLSGSYDLADVQFLLRYLDVTATPLEERERLIQSGQSHYSEMIGPEDAPSRFRMRLFRECLNANGRQFAQDIAVLASAMARSVSGDELTVVSIARAGTPVGALVGRRLKEIAPHLRVAHYSISVIRDRGVDLVALRWILARHRACSLRFVDGWTGKGTIARELRTSLPAWPDLPKDLDQGLWVPLDVCGAAVFAASARDYLIPSTLLGATVSGLISRTVLPRGNEGGDSLHGCVPLEHLRRYDLSRWFLRYMLAFVREIAPHGLPPRNASEGPLRSTQTSQCLNEMLARYKMTDANRVKLGIGETVRVLLRRLPRVIWLSADARPGDAAMIRKLAALRGVPVEIEDGLTFAAVAIIAEAGGN